MNSKCLFIVWLAFFTLGAARPRNKILNLGAESEPETKIREKRKYEIPLLRELEESGVGTKREASPREEAPAKAAEDELPSGAPAGAVQEEEVEKAEKEKGVGGEPETPPSAGPRVKKQSPNNVGSCGKTVCGPVVSARGPVVGDMRAMIQGGKPVITLGDVHPATFSGLNDVPSKVDHLGPVQGRTIDTFVTPVTLDNLGYGTPAGYSVPPTADFSHSFFKPPSVPAVAVITAPHQPSHPLIHPWLVPHLLPHLMPHLMPHIIPSLMSGLGSYLTPHRFEPSRLPEPVPNEYKPPVPNEYKPIVPNEYKPIVPNEYKPIVPSEYRPLVPNVFTQPSFSISGDGALLCQPYRNQRLDGPFEFYYKPDTAADKSINVTDGGKKSNEGIDLDDKRIQENLRKVNEIKEEISQLNRAAQRIVDQQERLTAMHQKQLWGGSGTPPATQGSEHSAPYMGSGYYAHPAMPWGYSRSNILSFPRSQDDIEFFLNLLRAGRKMGLLSDVVQPSVMSNIGEVFKGGQDGGKTQKDLTDSVTQSDDGKTVGKGDKKSTK